MAITQIPIGRKLGYAIQADSAALATVVADLDAGPTWLSSITFDNNDNATNYLKVWDARTPVIGTTGEAIIIPSATGTHQFVDCYLGLYFEYGLSYAVCTGAGTTSGDDPTTEADMYFVSSAGLAMRRSIGDQLTAAALQTSVTTTTMKTKLGSSWINLDDLGATKVAASAAASTLYGVTLDNRNNPNAKSYRKGYDAAIGDVTVGTTAPELVLFAPKGQRVTYIFPIGLPFATAITMAAVNAGGTAGDEGPSNAFGVGLYI